MTELSPAARQVYGAALKIWPAPINETIAAALRAAADQVAPLSTNRRQDDIRQKLLAIATELEGNIE